jgi:hypothetical protein
LIELHAGVYHYDTILHGDCDPSPEQIRAALKQVTKQFHFEMKEVPPPTDGKSRGKKRTS